MDAPVGEWLKAQAERGIAANTIRARRVELARWQRWCGDPLDPGRADDRALRAYLEAHPMAPASRAVLLSHLRAFYVWAIIEELAVIDPTIRIARPRVPRREPRPVDAADAERAQRLAESPRLRLILALAAGAGLRCCEIAALEWSAVRLSKRRLELDHTKGNRARTVPIRGGLVALLEAAPRPAPWVITRLHDPRLPLSAHRVGTLIASHLRACGIDATAHQLRHLWVTTACEYSDDLLAVGQMAGHASVTTTQGYAKVAARRARAVVDAMPDLVPRAR